ncbi:MAG: primosomal protein N' [Lachnospiraceae bacterium]|nr:primosomal protein N' [Lachnospiraceae bacterium]
MSNLYADIIVNISHEALDRSFQYRVPPALTDTVGIGDYVSIPFGKGNRIIQGYIIALSDKASIDGDRIKDIQSIVKDSSLVEGKLIKLAFWMKRRYGSTLIQALKTVLPIKKESRHKEERSLSLSISNEEALKELKLCEKKHHTARGRLLKALIETEEIEYSLVTGKLNISSATIKAMEEKGIIAVNSRRIYRNSKVSLKDHKNIILNEEQKEAVSDILEEMDRGERRSCLIHGITGSGKTEVYMELIERVVLKGKQVIVLIPEIALTFQTLMRFYDRFGDRVSTLHSKLSPGERYDQFERAKKGELSVMIGPRSALFTPFTNLGLIIIDEEHESSYKSDSMPKYAAKDVALELARLHGAFLILGSATPSVDTYYEAVSGRTGLVTLTKRASEGSKLARVKVVDLREELKKGNRSVLSTELKKDIEERLINNEQVMLFLNRRGYSGFVSCRACGEALKCPHCDVSLTLHKNNKLVCHYCGYEQDYIRKCPNCSSSLIAPMRAGTEQIEENINKLFPFARVLRMDGDTTRKKDDYDRILSSFANREADILVGTQMIVKGHDFPYVTLVGVLAADMSLYANDYRASERTFQLLTQAAGRAGRGKREGKVLIQTYNPEHYSIVASAHQDYGEFFENELAYRKFMSYPPLGHILAITSESSIESKGRVYLNDLADYLKNDIIAKGSEKWIKINPPVECSIKKIMDIYRRVLYVKSDRLEMLVEIKDRSENFIEEHKEEKVKISFDLDPVHGY